MRKGRGMTTEVRECLAEMGVTEAVFEKIRAASNHTDGERELEAAKEICRKGFKAIVSKYHPDQNQHLPLNERKTREERFVRLTSVRDSFLESRYRGPSRSRTQMGAINFDPFGFHRTSEAEEILRNWDNPHLAAIFKRMRDQERAERLQRFKDILNNGIPKSPPTPPGPKITPTRMPSGVWMRDEASCQPQPRKPRKRG
jgi:hypothetical protein